MSDPGQFSDSMSTSNQNLLDDLPQRKAPTPIPKWIPISMLAVSTAALAVPLVFMRRQRANTFLKNNPGPRRRSGVTPTRFTPTASQSLQHSSASAAPETEFQPGQDDHFNAPLYTAKAFGIATLLVGIGAVTTIYGTKAYFGVRDTKEFADRMRATLLTRLPALSHRIYRAFDTSDKHGGESPSVEAPEETEDVGWNWPDAERRLKDAFDRGGFSAWADAALREVESEGRVERLKRGLTPRTSEHDNS